MGPGKYQVLWDWTEQRKGQPLETPWWPGNPTLTCLPKEPKRDRRQEEFRGSQPSPAWSTQPPLWLLFLLRAQPTDSAQACRGFHFLLTLVPIHHQYQMIGILSVTELGWELRSRGNSTYGEGRFKVLPYPFRASTFTKTVTCP